VSHGACNRSVPTALCAARNGTILRSLAGLERNQLPGRLTPTNTCRPAGRTGEETAEENPPALPSLAYCTASSVSHEAPAVHYAPIPSKTQGHLSDPGCTRPVSNRSRGTAARSAGIGWEGSMMTGAGTARPVEMS
jgi:hypothetical protein